MSDEDDDPFSRNGSGAPDSDEAPSDNIGEDYNFLTNPPETASSASASATASASSGFLPSSWTSWMGGGGGGGGSSFSLSSMFGGGGDDDDGSGGSAFDFSNSIISKVVFMILTLMAFFFLLYIGVAILGYFIRNNNNPYIIKGMIPGNIQKIVHQNTSFNDAVTLNRSNNRPNGIEFSWSFWILVPSNTPFNAAGGGAPVGDMSSNANIKGLYQHIFSVGDLHNPIDNNVYEMNGPGVYLRKNVFDESDMQLIVMMDTASTLASSQQYWNVGSNAKTKNNVALPENILQINNLPVMKWIHVAIRVEGMTMDTYVNGIVAGRMVLDSVPRQNFYDINCCCNSGFNGSISNLQYYNHALTAFDINSIVYNGPNLTQSSNIADTTSYGKPYYLNNSWFLDKMAAK